MGVKLKKKHLKKLEVYFKYFNTNKQLNLVMDLTVVRESSIVKYNVVNCIKRNYDLEVELYTTSCLLEECRRLGEIMEKSYEVIKNYKVIKCNHKYNSQAGGSIKCLQRYLALWSGINEQPVSESDKCHIGDCKNWAIASNCPELSLFMPTVPGIIWFGFKFNVISLRKVTNATIIYIDDYERKKSQDLMKCLTTDNIGKDDVKKNKRKKAQKPNPLSVKKSTKKPDIVKKRRMNDGWKYVINELRQQKDLPVLTEFPDYLYFTDFHGFNFVGKDLING